MLASIRSDSVGQTIFIVQLAHWQAKHSCKLILHKVVLNVIPKAIAVIKVMQVFYILLSTQLVQMQKLYNKCHIYSEEN